VPGRDSKATKIAAGASRAHGHVTERMRGSPTPRRVPALREQKGGSPCRLSDVVSCAHHVGWTRRRWNHPPLHRRARGSIAPSDIAGTPHRKCARELSSATAGTEKHFAASAHFCSRSRAASSGLALYTSANACACDIHGARERCFSTSWFNCESASAGSLNAQAWAIVRKVIE